MRIGWPFKGLSFESGDTNPEPGTTREATNVVGFDSAEGKLRGGVRDGMAKVSSTSTTAVREIYETSFMPPIYTYAGVASGSEVEEWRAITPLRQWCPNVGYDIAGNAYGIDGRAGIFKRNADGKLAWKLVLPVKSTEHVCRALAVDPEGAVYVAVSAGDPQAEARIFKYRVRESGASVPNLEWEIKVGLYVEDMRLRNGFLYCATNDALTGASTIRVYRLIDTSSPEVAWERDQVPYPTNGIDVRGLDGAILTCHEANSTRAYNKLSPGTTKQAIDWTPRRFSFWDTDAWCELDASDIDGDDTFNSAYKNGDPVLRWRDKTGHNRDAWDIETLLGSAVTNCTAPTLAVKAFAGQDSVRFAAGATISNAHTALISAPNVSISSATSSSQLTLIPCYTGAPFTVFIVAQTSETSNGSSYARVLMMQRMDGSSNTRTIAVNASNSGGSLVYTAGSVALHTESAATIAGPYASYQTTDSTTPFVICGFSGVNSAAATLTGTNTVNGTSATNPTYTGQAMTSVISTQLGRGAANVTGTSNELSNAQPFDGNISYILVFKRVLTASEHEQVMGYLGWRFGTMHTYPTTHTYASAPPTVEGLPAATGTSPYAFLTRNEQMLVKWDPNNGKTRWAVTDSALSTGPGIGGLGYGCRWPGNGIDSYCFSMGPIGTSTAHTSTAARILTRNAVVRKTVDNGDTATVTGAGPVNLETTWEDAWGTSTSPTYHYPRMGISGVFEGYDPNNPQYGTSVQFSPVVVYAPFHTSDTTSTTAAAYQYLANGTNSGTNTETPPSRIIKVASQSRGYACAAPLEVPDYVPGLLGGGPGEDERVLLGTAKEGISDEAVYQKRQVAATRANVAARTSYVGGVSGTALVRISSTTATLGSSPTLVSTAYVSVASYQGMLYGTDGSTYFSLDPRSYPSTDGISRLLTPSGSGAFPKKSQLFSVCFQRLIMARNLDPHEVFFCAVGDPRNADTLPPEPTGYEAKRVPVDQPVTCLIPLSDDLLLVGQAGQFSRQTGDPAQGGQMDRVADMYGAPFGEPWGKDPSGRTFVFLTSGDVVMIGASGKIESISRRMKRVFEALDLSTKRIRLVWNSTMRGLHLFVCPITASGSTSTHYFWESETDAWYQFDLPYVVMAARSIDADGSGQRAVWMACSDGYVRKFSNTAVNDDGIAIYSHVMLAQYQSEERLLFKRPQVTLAANLGGARVGFHVSDSAQNMGVAVIERDLVPGQNPKLPMSARGNHIGVRIASADLNKRWAFEDCTVVAIPFGQRDRTSA